MSAAKDFVEKARRKLVDTSMRSRLLNYVSGKRSTGVEVLREHPVALWEALVVKGRSLQFRGIEKPGDQIEFNESSEIEPEDETSFTELGDATKPEHVDSFLDTDIEQELLGARIRRLADAMRGALEEQGVATLFLALGFLHYFESDDSEKQRRAPLLLVPVVPTRTKAGKWSIKASDDEPLINPALVEYLSSQHGLQLESMPDEGFDPARWLEVLRKQVGSKRNWKVSATCLLSNFTFHKFVMHEDLKKNIATIAQHPIVEMLARRTGTSAAMGSLPGSIARKDLDATFAPEATFQVVDADSTQQRALAAVASGLSLVIQGPPGTGKSQTITNLISSALAAGQSVLFVAEKQAALNVVHDRLCKAGLGDFCLELHSTKANKKVLLSELKRAWDASTKPAAPAPRAPEELARLRKELTHYVRALHAPRSPLELSPFAAMGRVWELDGAINTRVALETRDVSAEALAVAIAAVSEVAGVASAVGTIERHPWFGSTITHLSLPAQEELFDAIDQLVSLLQEITRDEQAIEERYGVSFSTVRTAADELSSFARVLEKSPGIPVEVLGDSDWNAASARALQVIARGKAFQRRERAADSTLSLTPPIDGLSDAVDIVLARGNSFWAWFSSKWRAARRLLRSTVGVGWDGAYKSAQRVAELLKIKAEREALGSLGEPARFFNRLWCGADSNWEQLRAWVDWGAQFRQVAGRFSTTSRVLALAASPTPDVGLLIDASARMARARTLWNTIRRLGCWSDGFLAGASFQELSERLRLLDSGRSTWRQWAAFLAALTKARATSARPVCDAALAGELEWTDAAEAFERRFLMLWLDRVEREEPALGEFDAADHARRIETFRALDREALETNRSLIASKLRAETQEKLQRAVEDARFLRDQLSRERGHKPVRQLIQRAHRAVRAIKPCFLMSPMTVAQTLGTDMAFDVVIFDEASQLTTEDAVGAVARGKQLVVVGDPKQLPPTNFFSAQLGEVQVQENSDGEPVYEDLESVLELAQAAGFHGAQLRWHYRSRHETLIAYSNQNFYDASLLTFPSVDRSVGDFGLSFELIADGQYEGKGTNSKEAAAVVAAVVRHSREQPTRSLCVGTFSLPQQLRIQDLLERERRVDPTLDDFLSLDKPEPFFVKNLESIQGDERDVVFLSVTYGRGVDGKLRYNFGPLGGQSGWRRLNVLTTRARERMVVFSSMRADEMVVDASMRGATLLRDFLKYAETQELTAGPLVSAMASTESPFEKEVLAALTARGIALVPQVGVAGYKVDFGVVDSDLPGRFVCGIECDGVAYHSAESARDRDRLREEVLRGLGWELHRVWSTDWWHDRNAATDRLVSLITRSRESAKQYNGRRKIVGANAAAKPSTPKEVAAPELNVRRDLVACVFAPFEFATLPPQTTDLLGATESSILRVARSILELEGPVAEAALRLRVLNAFGHRRSGSKLTDRLDSALRVLRVSPEIEAADGWFRLKARPVVARSRKGTDASADSIAPSEFSGGILVALNVNRVLSEEDCVSVVRDGFGFGSASSRFREEILAALERLVGEGKVVHRSDGYALVDPASLPQAVKVASPVEEPRPAPLGPEQIQRVVARLRVLGFEAIDKTSSKGSLWVVGPESIGDQLRLFASDGVRFVFAKNGSGTTGDRPGWYWKPPPQ